MLSINNIKPLQPPYFWPTIIPHLSLIMDYQNKLHAALALAGYSDAFFHMACTATLPEKEKPSRAHRQIIPECEHCRVLALEGQGV